MIINIRCFSCGKVLADKYDYYLDEVRKLVNEMEIAASAPAPTSVVGPVKKEKKSKRAVEGGAGSTSLAGPSKPKEPEPDMFRHFDKTRTGPIMDKLGLTRYCCRRHMLGTVDMMDSI